jgi:hypothetical protein
MVDLVLVMTLLNYLLVELVELLIGVEVVGDQPFRLLELVLELHLQLMELVVEGLQLLTPQQVLLVVLESQDLFTS